MGREVRRVPLDFDWPIGEIWEGYLQPDRLHETPCEDCSGRGQLIQAAGLDPDVWGICTTCQGHGSIEKYPGQREESEAWEPTDPPTGDGWQLWGTTSEGEPMTPVFATAEALARYCADERVSMFGSNTAGYDQWLSIVTGEDFAHVEIAPGVVVM